MHIYVIINLKKPEDMENPYHHSKIYRLEADDSYFYIGATTQKLCARYQDHVGFSKINTKRKVYIHFTHEKFTNKEIKIVLCEEVKCDNI